MVIKLTFGQIRTFLITSLALFSIWIFMGHYARFSVPESSPAGTVTVNVSFLSPMNKKKLADHLTVNCEIPGRAVNYSTRWISRNTVQVIIEETKYPRGLEYSLSFKKAPALIPPFTVTIGKKVRLSLAPEVIALEPAANTPTKGPLVLVFNTPVDPESFKSHVSTNAPGSFAPRPVSSPEQPGGYDYSRWLLTPDKRFANGASYEITINEGLRSTGGGVSNISRNISFTTAPALNIIDMYPRPEAPSIWLSRNITVRAGQKLREANITVDGVRGSVSVTGDTAVFHPEELFLPAKRYGVKIKLVSEFGEEVQKEFNFGTTDLGSQRWIGIKTGNPCSIQVYEGNTPIKSFQGWISIAEEKVPRVTMYETQRGSTLEFNPGDKSPVKYIMLNADLMIHHLRPGGTDNHSETGLPACYGCILLNKSDLDWIYSNVPPKCMVIIY
ncbi:MAG: L,D-transpeptidase family protein [Bacillota bacterium]